ncbi:hypothetical protein SAMN04487884_104119 [Butyrivibrio fibrisolvens]|uniref:Uncharacterized protein n=2 Tax=Butyrivibrio fibrisolvens TaxID=831 RepID=A0A1H9NBB4_BUTFI|nr:hypothetical protein SAMN04487884_104119 [Butyrivibrio fibrisolvens]
MNKKTLMKSLAVVTAGVLIFTHAPTVMATASIEGTGSVVSSSGKLNGSTDEQWDPASIDVFVTTEGGSDIIYDVDITYGSMKFVYDYGSVWDPDTHRYTAGSSGKQSGGWVTSGVNGTNNKITITNNSNFPMQADFAYTAVDEGDGKLNSSTTTGSVIGIFTDDNSKLTEAVLAEGLNGSTVSTMQTRSLVLEMDISNLAVGDSYYKYSDGGLTEDDVYFALSGKPDKGLSLNSKIVGTIGITITPCQGVEATDKQ